MTKTTLFVVAAFTVLLAQSAYGQEPSVANANRNWTEIPEAYRRMLPVTHAKAKPSQRNSDVRVTAQHTTTSLHTHTSINSPTVFEK